MECFCYVRNVQDLLEDGKTPHERRFGEPFKGPVIPFGAMLEYYTTSARDQSRLHPFGKKVMPGMFLGYASIVEGIWKGYILVADLEDLEKLHASEIYPRRINAKEVLISQKKERTIHFPRSRWKSKIVRKRPRIPRIHSEAGTHRKEENWNGLNRQKRKMTLMPGKTSGRFKVTSSIVITMNLEFNSMCREKKHSPFHWNILVQLTLIWTCCKKNVLMTIGMSIRTEVYQIRGKAFTKFTPLKQKPPKGYVWSGERLAKVQTTSTTDHVWPEVCTKMGKAAQNREKQEWKNEKPNVDNVRRLKGIYFVDPDDQVFKETVKKARRKLERPMAATVPCKRKLDLAPRRWLQSRKLHPNRFQKRFMTVQVESHESTRQRVEPT